MTYSSRLKLSTDNFSPDTDLIEVFSKKAGVVGVINPSQISVPPSGVSGAIQFSNGSAFASDATNFFWDNTNKRLGLGTNAPTSKLQIVTDDATNPQVFSNQTSVIAGTASQGALIGAFSSTNGGFINALWPGNSWFKMNYGGTSHSFSTSGTVMAVIDSNTTFGNGATSLGARLGIKGSGSTSATTSLLVQNSAGTQLLKLTDDGRLTIGVNATFFGDSGNFISNYSGGVTALIIASAGSSSKTLQLRGGSGSADIQTWETNGGGSTLGVFTSDGKLGLGVSTVNASAKLQVDSTTQGFLPPRMTTTQINAIASPANGLEVYNTTLAQPCFYDGTSWRKVSHTTM